MSRTREIHHSSVTPGGRVGVTLVRGDVFDVGGARLPVAEPAEGVPLTVAVAEGNGVMDMLDAQTACRCWRLIPAGTLGAPVGGTPWNVTIVGVVGAAVFPCRVCAAHLSAAGAAAPGPGPIGFMGGVLGRAVAALRKIDAGVRGTGAPRLSARAGLGCAEPPVGVEVSHVTVVT